MNYRDHRHELHLPLQLKEKTKNEIALLSLYNNYFIIVCQMRHFELQPSEVEKFKRRNQLTQKKLILMAVILYLDTFRWCFIYSLNLVKTSHIRILISFEVLHSWLTLPWQVVKVVSPGHALHVRPSIY